MSSSADRSDGGWIAPVPEGAAWAGRKHGWNIKLGTTTIGRGDDCDIQIRDPKISRLHVELSWDKNDLYLIHRSRTNETLLMGLPVPRDQPRQLANSTTRIELAEGIAIDVKIFTAVADAATVQGRKHPKLVTTVIADASGYSAGIESDQSRTHALLTRCHQVCLNQTKLNGGRLVNWSGDSILLVFDSVVGAIWAAIETQNDLRHLNSNLPREEQMLFRFGMSAGDIDIRDDEETGGKLAYGDAINVASRLEQMAEPGEIYASHTVRELCRGRKDFSFERVMEVKPKKMSQSVTVYTVVPSSNSEL